VLDPWTVIEGRKDIDHVSFFERLRGIRPDRSRQLFWPVRLKWLRGTSHKFITRHWWQCGYEDAPWRKQQVGYIRYTSILGAVQNSPLMNAVFQKYRPKVVFHAAAYKHVPMLEENPWQAVINNIAGTQEIMERSIEHKAEYFVLTLEPGEILTKDVVLQK